MEKIDLSNSTIQEKVKGICASFEKAINNLDKEPIFIVIATKKGYEIQTILFSEGITYFEEFIIIDSLLENIQKKTLETLKK